jgi:hypothetical protein
MRLCLTICALALAGCSRPVEYVEVRPEVPADLLAPCDGWTGTPPVTEGDLLRALSAERGGRLCTADRLAAVGEIVGPR